jgi:polyisoprenoid-binding protein YceI
MRSPPLLLAAVLLFAPALARAAPRTLALAPDDATFGLRAYALGLMPVDARVSRFAGTLTYDPAAPGRCEVRMTAEVASVETGDPGTRETILGPDFMDAARFPTLSFTGVCSAADTIAGNLTMRGVTRPLALTLDWRAHRLVAHGALHRADWGMGARPFAVGPTIGVRVAATLP